MPRKMIENTSDENKSPHPSPGRNPAPHSETFRGETASLTSICKSWGVMKLQLEKANLDYSKTYNIASKGYDRVLIAKKWHAHHLSVANDMADKVDALETLLDLLQAAVHTKTALKKTANLITSGSPASHHSTGSSIFNFTPSSIILSW